MKSKKIRILITDGNLRPALAATRSLARNWFEVITAHEKFSSLAASSRYCKEHFVYPSPLLLSDEFLKVIEKECINRLIDIILPMTEITTHLILSERTLFESIGCKVPFPDLSCFNMVSDKIRLLKLAKELNIPTPESHFIYRLEDIQNLRKELKFPMVMKPCRSCNRSEKGWLYAGVRYAKDFAQLEKAYSQERAFREFPFILQEHIKGQGCGLFVLYNRGAPITYFAHKRLREKPPSGGVSVLCESAPIDSQIRQYAERLFSKIGWHGVAMVEFKRCQRTGIPYLMEVNGRFWGSLQLAIAAGIDFPSLLCRLTAEKEINPPQAYQVGLKNRWLLGDLDSLYLTLFSNGLSPSKMRGINKLKAIYEFFKFFQKNTHFEILSLEDPKPFLFELRQYLKDLTIFH